jgi:hypothetical protein
MKHEVALPAVAQMHPVQCPAPATGAAVRAAPDVTLLEVRRVSIKVGVVDPAEPCVF